MPYDEQGNFYGSDEDLGALEEKYTKPNLASQIPGQVSSSKPNEPKSLRERAVLALTQANPLMLGKSLQDMTRTLVGGAALPVVAPVSAGVQALNALPGNLLRRSRGEEEVKTPSTEDLMRKYGEFIAPKTQMGQEFEEGLGKAMDVAKVPHAWSLSPSAPRRPLLTPTDVRVGAGQMKQLAKELRETPADFQAAQSGLKRQNLYGEDTIGVKAQAAADALGDTLERRQASGKSVIPGVPQALTPDNKMYAVRPKGTRMVQPKVPESARGYMPEFSGLDDLVSNVYGDTPAAQMPPEMIMQEYSKRYLPPDSEIRGVITNYERLKAQEMFPDAPTPRDAQNAYNVLYNNRTERKKQQLATVEEFLNLPENAAYRETTPTPSEFMQRMGEAERIVKGPFTTYLSKNVGAEGDPTVKLARQGITFESPETIQQLANFANPTELAKRRVEAGFPAMGTFYGERIEKTGQLDRLNDEIEALEQVRQPLFDQAHTEGIDPASIPEYAETTNPLRQKLRQKELLLGEIENIKLAQDVESVSDSAVNTKTKQQVLERIPYEQRQFFPGVTKAGEEEKMYTANRSLLRDMGYEKLGKELVEDILTGKAGDTSKLTVENYMREKGLSRIEAEKAAKLQEQQYRTTLQNILLERIRNDQNVQTFGNAAIITLDQNTPKDVAMRDMSADTAVLDHCVGECGTAPQGRKNILSGKQQYYEPVIDPITGERSSRASGDTRFVKDLEKGAELVSVRDVKTGLPAATIQLMPNSDGSFRIGYASGAKNKTVDPAYIPAIRDYLNQRSSAIRDTGSDLIDNTGIFDINNAGEFKRAIREAGVDKDKARALELNNDLPRFVTVDDVKAAAKGMTGTEVAVVNQAAVQAPAPAARGRVTFNEFNGNLTFDEIERLVSNISNDPTYTRRQLQRLRTLIEDPDHRAFRWLDEDQVGGLLNIVEGGLQQPRARGGQAPVVEPQRQQAPAQRYEINWIENPLDRRIAERWTVPVPEDLEAQDLLDGYANRLSPEQTRWLRNWQDQFNQVAEGSRQEQRLVDVYREWQADNTLAPDPLANLFDDLEPDPTAVANQGAGLPAPVEPQPAAQMAQRDPVPRNIQTLATGDIINNMSQVWNTRAQTLADTYFNDNLIDGQNVSIGSLTGMLRDYRIGPHAEAPAEVRELAARRLESMHAESMGVADQIGNSLNEAFYGDMDPVDAVDQITRDIEMLRRDGENSWEDLVGPMAEDTPWDRNLQHHLIQYLQELAEEYGSRREEGYAKGGMVKKKRKANKAGTPSVVTRKSPELAEMQYRYGGMVV